MMWFIIGVFLIYVGIMGNPGTLLAALIVPGALQENTQS